MRRRCRRFGQCDLLARKEKKGHWWWLRQSTTSTLARPMPGSADTRCIKVSRAAMNCVVSHGVCCVRSFCPEYHSRALAPSSSRMADSGSGTGRGTAAASVGGSRTALARRTNTRTGAGAGANSGKKAGGGGGGILKFYSDDTPGLKVGPTTVLVLSLVFMAIVCSLHILGKFRSG
eukprot:s1032_g13.t4